MKSIRIAGLIPLLALGIVMLVAQGSASATQVCTQAVETCEGKAIYGEGTKIKASLEIGTVGEVVTNIGTVKCTESTIEAETTSGSGLPMTGVVTNLTFEGCSIRVLLTVTCTIGKAQNLPYNGTLEWTEGNSGLLTAEEGEGGSEPSAHVVCLGGLINCNYGVGMPTLEAVGGNPATVYVREIELNVEGGGCPEEAIWNATYTVSEPKPAYITM